MLDRLRQLLEMIRFSHTIFALPFALLAAVMAWSAPAPDGSAVGFRGLDLVGILLCMVGARSAAMAFNRIVDRHLDAENPRTQQRHLPAGRLSLRSVVLFTLASALLFVGGTLLFLPANPWPVILGVPVLLFLFGYSYTKRFTSLAHFWLGTALMLAPVCAWIAIRGTWLVEHPSDIVPAVLLGLGVLMWVSGFDMIYACQDVDVDRRLRLRSVPTWLGVRGALRAAALCHLLMLVVLVLLPWSQQLGGPPVSLGWIYGIGLSCVAALLIYEHALVRPDDLSRVNLAFFHVNSVVSIGLFAVTTIDLLT